MPFRSAQQPGSAQSHVNPRARTRPPMEMREPLQAVPAIASPAKKRAHHKVDRTGPNWDADGEYVVGKRRPPENTRWKKGQSGNPRGPVKREPLSAQAQFEKMFLAPFNATVNGETVQLTMDMFAVQSLKSAAAKGSVTAARTLLDYCMAVFRKITATEPGPEVEAWEQEAIDRLLSELGIPERPVVRQTRRSGDQS